MSKYKISIYKIWWVENEQHLYIGSTKQKISSRISRHRSDCRKGCTQKLYTAMREYGYDFKYILLKEYKVSNRQQQLQKEQKWIDKLKPKLNQKRAFTTKEQKIVQKKDIFKKYYDKNKNELKKNKNKWYIENKVYVSEYNKNHYKNNKEKLLKKKKAWTKDNKNIISERNKRNYENLTKINCHCGKHYNYGHKNSRNRHIISVIHLQFAANIESMSIFKREILTFKKDFVVMCHCGGSYKYNFTSRKKIHFNSKKHIQFKNSIMLQD